MFCGKLSHSHVLKTDKDDPRGVGAVTFFVGARFYSSGSESSRYLPLKSHYPEHY